MKCRSKNNNCHENANPTNTKGIEYMKRLLDRIKNVKSSAYFIVFGFDIISKIINAMTILFVIRILTTEEYAVYTKFTSISTLFYSIIGTGLSVAFVRFAAEKISRGDRRIKGLYLTCACFAILLTIISLLLTKVVEIGYNVPAIVAILSVMYGGLLSLNGINDSFFQAEEQYSKSGVLTNIKYIILFISVFAVYFTLKELNSANVIIITLLTSIIALVIGFLWCIKAFSVSGENATVSILALKELLKESGWLILYCIFLTLFDQIGFIIMSSVSTDMDISVYGIALKYYSIMLMLLQSLKTVIRIKTSKKEFVDNANTRSSFSINWLKKSWKLSVALFVVAQITVGFIFPVLNGSGYDAAIPVFRILLIGVSISYIFAPNVGIMMAAKRHKLLCLIAFCCFSISCVLCFTLIPTIGAIGASISTVVSNAILNITCSLIIIYSGKHSNSNNQASI